MGAPPAGAIVLVRFPFSNLSQTKLRPAVVLADVGPGDPILCQVTSKAYGDRRAVKLDDTDLATEQVADDAVHGQESLRLGGRFEPAI